MNGWSWFSHAGCMHSTMVVGVDGLEHHGQVEILLVSHSAKTLGFF